MSASDNAALEDRDVFTMMRAGQEIGRRVVEQFRESAQLGEPLLRIMELDAWCIQVVQLLDGWVVQYMEAVCVQPDPETVPDDSSHEDGNAIVGPPVEVEEILRALEETRPLKHEHGAINLPEVPDSGNVPLPNGCRLYWETDKALGIRTYSSDEIGGGVDVWNTALIDPTTLLTAIITEEHLGRLELERARRRIGDTMSKSAQTFSIFGQIEAAAAEVMIADGDITKIEAHMIPASVRTNEHGQHALFAVIVPADRLARFEKLIADLRA